MKINHITVLVKDNKAAADYYSNTLELGEIRIVNENHYWVTIGDVYIHLAANSGKPVRDSFHHFAVEVDDLSSYLQKIESKGVDIIREDKQYFIKDLDGNLIELIDSNNDFFK